MSNKASALGSSEEPKAIPPEFLVAGHSNYFSMGAPQGYKGPRRLIETRVGDRRGYFVMELDSGPRTDDYWNLLVESAWARDVVLSWNGNQHIVGFLFELDPPVDFLDESVIGGGDLQPGAMVVPRRLIKAYFKHTIDPLNQLLRRLAPRANSVTIVGTPPPRRSLADIEHRIMRAPYWQQVAARCGVNLETAKLSAPALMLKLWAVIQEMLAEAAHAEEKVRFAPVPDKLRDDRGFLLDECGISTDFTHANELFGRPMLNLALS